MILLNINEISNFIKGKLIGNKNILIDSISINSKKINTKNCIFLAFKGKNFNSHIFINDSIKNGAVAIITEFFIKNIKITQIIVKNSNESLYKISELIRKKSKAFFIVITGSNGKTTVKEMLVNILKQTNIKFSYSLNNNNNLIGISLTLLNININDKFVILELGIDKIGQMLKYVNLIKPNLIFINNIFISHFKNFNCLKNIILAKGEIFYGLSDKLNSRLIINYYNNYWNEWKFYFCNINRYPTFFSCLYNKISSFYATNIKNNILSSKFKIHTPIGKKYINLNLPGNNNISNSIGASSISISIGLNLTNIYKGLLYMKSINRRLNPIFIGYNKIILDDTYNSNIESLIVSIEILSKFPGYKLLILGDMLDLGIFSKLLHLIIVKKIKTFKIDKIISFGNFSKIITFNLKNGIHIENKKKLLKKIIDIINNKNKITLLFKASRNMNFDILVKYIINIYNFNYEHI